MSTTETYTYIVEHLDPELEAWSALEYKSIATESHASNARFLLSSVPADFKLPQNLQNVQGLEVKHESVEELYAGELKGEVCLLDPKAAKELSPEDAKTFSVFLFGGILGSHSLPRFHDEVTKSMNAGDDPPRDRTSELRAKGFEGRRLGPVQMTTDTAVRVTRMVVQEDYELEKIPYVDHPEIKVDEHESTEMPFRYVKGKNGEVVMPEVRRICVVTCDMVLIDLQGMLDLIKKDTEKGLDDLL